MKVKKQIQNQDSVFDKGTYIGFIIALVYLLVLAAAIIFCLELKVKDCAIEYKKANETVEYWIQQNKLLEKERDEILSVNEQLNQQKGTFQRQINNNNQYIKNTL